MQRDEKNIVSVAYCDREHIIVVTAVGAMDGDAIRQSRVDALRLVREHDCQLILADLRHVTSSHTTLEIFNQP